MTRLILLIGLPASGKSSLAQQLISQCPTRRIISTDAIRASLFGDEIIQGDWQLVWNEIQRQFRQAVEQIASLEGGTAIYDATNAVCKHRQEAISLALATGFTRITGLWVDTPLEECLKRNLKRSRVVPEEAILHMHRHLQDAPPAFSDGIDRLIRQRGTSREIAIAPIRKNRTRPQLSF